MQTSKLFFGRPLPEAGEPRQAAHAVMRTHPCALGAEVYEIIKHLRALSPEHGDRYKTGVANFKTWLHKFSTAPNYLHWRALCGAQYQLATSIDLCPETSWKEALDHAAMDEFFSTGSIIWTTPPSLMAALDIFAPNTEPLVLRSIYHHAERSCLAQFDVWTDEHSFTMAAIGGIMGYYCDFPDEKEAFPHTVIEALRRSRAAVWRGDGMMARTKLIQVMQCRSAVWALPSLARVANAIPFGSPSWVLVRNCGVQLLETRLRLLQHDSGDSAGREIFGDFPRRPEPSRLPSDFRLAMRRTEAYLHRWKSTKDWPQELCVYTDPGVLGGCNEQVFLNYFASPMLRQPQTTVEPNLPVQRPEKNHYQMLKALIDRLLDNPRNKQQAQLALDRWKENAYEPDRLQPIIRIARLEGADNLVAALEEVRSA